MDVSCPECQTLYEFDDRQVRARDGVTLQCSHCDHLFRLTTDSGPRDERQRRWMVRAPDTGDILYFTTFQTLHEWIMEGRVDKDAAISRTGKSWKKLEEMGEFAPIFQVVASIADLTGDGEAERSESGGAEDDQSEDGSPRRRQSTDVQFDVEDVSSSTSAATKPAAKAATSPGMPASTGPTETERKVTPSTASSSRSGAPPKKHGAPKKKHGAPKTNKKRQGSGESASGRRADRPPQSTPTPRLKDQRLRSRGAEEETPAETGDDWTLGAMEHEDPGDSGGEELDVDMTSVQRRRWPAILVALLVVGAATGVWQRDAIEEFVSSQPGGASDEEVDEGSDDPQAEAMAELRRGVGESLEEARAAGRRMETAAVAVRAREIVAEAHLAAQHEADDTGPPTVSELLTAGRRSLDQGRTREGLGYFQAALEQSPDHPRALHGLGEARLGMGQYDRAINKFDAARRIDPGMGEVLISIGTAHRALGRDQQALEAYEEYLERFPDGPQVSIAEFQSEQLSE